MKEVDFLLGEKVLEKQKTLSYKAPQVLLIFFTAVAVVSLDCFFLGIGLVMKILSDFKWLTICLFLLKLIVDTAVFAGWFFAVKEREDRAKCTSFTVTETRFIILCEKDGETTFSWFDRKKTKVELKRDFLRKIYGVCAVRLVCGKYKSKINFAWESIDSLRPYLNKT